MIPCLNGGKCRGINVCRCPWGFRGAHCEIEAPAAHVRKYLRQAECRRPCRNGYCVGNNRCKCDIGWYGKHCNRSTYSLSDIYLEKARDSLLVFKNVYLNTKNWNWLILVSGNPRVRSAPNNRQNNDGEKKRKRVWVWLGNNTLKSFFASTVFAMINWLQFLRYRFCSHFPSLSQQKKKLWTSDSHVRENTTELLKPGHPRLHFIEYTVVDYGHEDEKKFCLLLLRPMHRSWHFFSWKKKTGSLPLLQLTNGLENHFEVTDRVHVTISNRDFSIGCNVLPIEDCTNQSFMKAFRTHLTTAKPSVIFWLHQSELHSWWEKSGTELPQNGRTMGYRPSSYQ